MRKEILSSEFKTYQCFFAGTRSKGKKTPRGIIFW